MDFNDLYYQHQLSLMQAAATSNPEARTNYLGMADRYASRINAALGGQPKDGPHHFLLRSARSILRRAARLAR
jgi:hypothetical protein